MSIVPVDAADIDVDGALSKPLKRLRGLPILFRVQRLRVENLSSNLSGLTLL
jgi:hypothetical protein